MDIKIPFELGSYPLKICKHMQFTLGFMAIILLGIIGSWLPFWWSFVPSTFFVGFILQTPNVQSFFCGFLGMSGLWGAYAYYLDSTNASILSQKIASVLDISSSFYLF